MGLSSPWVIRSVVKESEFVESEFVVNKLQRLERANLKTVKINKYLTKRRPGYFERG